MILYLKCSPSGLLLPENIAPSEEQMISASDLNLLAPQEALRIVTDCLGLH